jgi:hypothetical protein
MRKILLISCCLLLSIGTGIGIAAATACPHPQQVSIAWNIAGRSAVSSILNININKDKVFFPEVVLRPHEITHTNGQTTCEYYPVLDGNPLFAIVKETAEVQDVKK